MKPEIYKSSAREKIQVAFLTLFWMMGGLYFFLQGYVNFRHPWLWGALILVGLVVCVRQWSQAQTTLELRDEHLLWKTFGATHTIPYEDLLSVEENVDRNRLFLRVKGGKVYKLGLGDRNYKRLLSSLYERSPSLRANLVIPRVIGISLRYVLTYFLVFLLPAISSFYFVYASPSWFRILIACSLIVFMLISLSSLVGELPLSYGFRSDRLTLTFLFRKKVEIPYRQIERVIVVLDKSGFWHATLMLEDSSFWEISEVRMSKSLYLYFLFIRDSLNVSSINA